MKYQHRLTILTMCVPLIIGAVPLAAGETTPPSYVVYDTGTLGGTFSFGSGLSELGWRTRRSIC
jgi:hypothetical protein